MDAIGSRIAIDGPISVDGVVAQRDYFTSFLAEAIGREVVRPAMHELTALGCAMLSAGPDMPQPVVGAAMHFAPDARRGLLWRERFVGAVLRSRGWR